MVPFSYDSDRVALGYLGARLSAMRSAFDIATPLLDRDPLHKGVAKLHGENFELKKEISPTPPPLSSHIKY